MVKGITNISRIQKELRGYEQVDMPYTFTPKTKIKYITLEESTNSEGFFVGGEYSRMGNERVILQNGPSIWSVPVRVRDDNNDIIQVDLRNTRNYYTRSYQNTKNLCK